MNKSQLAQHRNLLRSLTAQLLKAGVTGLAYPADIIDQMSPSTLLSCIRWAEGTLEHAQ